MKQKNVACALPQNYFSFYMSCIVTTLFYLEIHKSKNRKYLLKCVGQL